MNGHTDWQTVAIIVGLALITVLTRCFFFLTRKSACRTGPSAACSTPPLPPCLLWCCPRC